MPLSTTREGLLTETLPPPFRVESRSPPRRDRGRHYLEGEAVLRDHDVGIRTGLPVVGVDAQRGTAADAPAPSPSRTPIRLPDLVGGRGPFCDLPSLFLLATPTCSRCTDYGTTLKWK
jgi:hypothetical protein